MTLSLTKLSQILLEDNTEFQLVRYIFQKQQFQLGRINFTDAAEKIHVSERTIGRTVEKLQQKNLVTVDRGKVKINPALQG